MKRLAALVGVLAIFAAGAGQAIDPDRSLHQLVHTSWRVTDGAPTSVWAMAQTPDGYLWLGTGSGLYRFDGARFERFRTSAADRLGQDIISLLALSNGDLWIGYQHGGVSVLRNGKLSSYLEGLPRGPIFLKVDSQNHVWAVSNDVYSTGGLARFEGGSWKTVGPQLGVPNEKIDSFLLDHAGIFWMATKSGLRFLRPGAPRFMDARVALTQNGGLAIGPDGRLWVADDRLGARHLAPSSSSSSLPSAEPARFSLQPVARRMIFDRDGGLWRVPLGRGLLRVAFPNARIPARVGKPVLDTFRLTDGLTSDYTSAVMEDSEGSVWVGTNLGLDRFRAGDVVAEEAIPQTSHAGYKAVVDKGGALYIAGADAFFRVGKGGAVRRLGPMKLPSAICARRDGPLMLAFDHRFLEWSGSRLHTAQLPPATQQNNVVACQEDALGRLWIAVLDQGVFRRDGSAWRKVSPLGPEPRATPNMMVADPRGGMWLYYEGSPLVFVKDDLTQTFSPKEGLDVGSVDGMLASRDDVLVSGDRGLARLKGDRFQVLRSQNSEPLSRATGILETTAGETWFNSLDGVVRVPTRALRDAFDRPRGKLPLKIFDFRDGLQGLAQQDSYRQTALVGPEGKLWFVTSHGMAWIDPAHLTHDDPPPPVLIQSVRANGRDYPFGANFRLPKNISNLQISYTSPGLSLPDKLNFTYKLDGVDKHWVDAGPRRQAFYTSLAPGSYIFRVVATNRDNIRSAAATSISFRVLPSLIQTNLFKGFCLLVFFVLLAAIYVFTLQVMSERIRGRLQERLGERERIARELHDTLLQGFQGLMLKFQSVADRIPLDQPLRKVMEDVLESADRVLIEGRDRIVNLRAEDPRELSQALLDAGERCKAGMAVEFRVVVQGTARDLHPLVREEVSRIGDEAISNAFRHASASLVEAVIIYERNALHLSITDNGIGIDPVVLASGGRNKHFGLSGMHERAARIRSNLEVSSHRSHRRAGTEVTLNVPGVFAYSTRQSRLFRLPGGPGPIEV